MKMTAPVFCERVGRNINVSEERSSLDPEEARMCVRATLWCQNTVRYSLGRPSAIVIEPRVSNNTGGCFTGHK